MQVIAHIRGQIEHGDLSPGDRIPSDRQIASTWKISRATAQKVITGLVTEGVAETIPGVGTRVAKTRRHASGRDRAASVRRSGRIYREGEYARITVAEVAPAPEDVADALGLDVGAAAIRRVRTTYGPDNSPVSTSTSWFHAMHAETAPLLLVRDRIASGTWAYLEQQTGLTAVHGEDRIDADAADSDAAALFNVATGSPVKVSKTALRTADGTVLEYGVSVSPAGREVVYHYDVGH